MQLEGAIASVMGLNYTGFGSKFIPWLGEFAGKGPLARQSDLGRLPGMLSPMQSLVSGGGNRMANTAQYLQGISGRLGRIPRSFDPFNPDRADVLGLEGQIQTYSIAQGAVTALEQDREAAMSSALASNFVTTHHGLVVAANDMYRNLTSTADAVFAAIQAMRAQIYEGVISRVENYTPMMGAAGRGMIAQDAGMYQTIMGKRGLPGRTGYLGMQGLGFEQNQRMQRIFAQGRIGRLREQGGMLSSQAANFDALSTFNAGSPQGIKFGKEAILLAEQARNAFEQAAIAEEKFAIRNFDVQQTFTAGWQAVFDNFKENAQNFMDIGMQMATSLTDGLGTAFSEMVTGAKSAGDAFRDMGYQFLTSASKMLSNKLFEMLLGAIMPAASTGTGMGASTASIVMRGITGGAVWPGSNASGGLLGGDNMLFSGQSGEYVIPRHAVEKYGVSHFDAYRKGGMPTLPVNSAVVPVNIVVNIDGKGGATVDAKSAREDADMMSRGIRMAVQEELLRQHRQGGVFKGRG
jgi:hypothetical protein